MGTGRIGRYHNLRHADIVIEEGIQSIYCQFQCLICDELVVV